jgi:prophage regulatory protein
MEPALPRILTFKELMLLVPYTRQHILRLEKKGKFPKRVRIGPRRVGWWLSEILEWLQTRPTDTPPAMIPR